MTKEEVSNLAEEFTEKICKALKQKCWETETSDDERFTEEAQDIYNSLIDLIDEHLHLEQTS